MRCCLLRAYACGGQPHEGRGLAAESRLASLQQGRQSAELCAAHADAGTGQRADRVFGGTGIRKTAFLVLNSAW